MSDTRHRITAALLALLVLVLAGGAAATASGGCPGPAAIAHRGESALAPEETAPAIVAALKGGAKVVEFDIRWSRSDTAVLMHDPTVNRTTNGTGYVSDLWTYQLRALDAGSAFSPAYAGTKIPTLGEALRLVRPYAGVTATPELKDSPSDAHLVGVAKTLADNGMTDRVIIHSFSTDTLRRFHAIAPTIRLGLGTDALPADPIRAVKAAGATYWHAKASTLTAANVEAAHDADITVWAWTVDSPAGWERLATLEADGVLTNRASRYVGWVTARCGVTP